jgi:hypothetical protein
MKLYSSTESTVSYVVDTKLLAKVEALASKGYPAC